MSVGAATTVSAALFAVYHFQAQSLASWPLILAMSLVFANLRVKGLSLFWLAIIHAIIDVMYFGFRTIEPGTWSLHGMMLLTGLIVYYYMTRPSRSFRWKAHLNAT